MQLVIITALGVGMATVFGSFIGFALKKIPHKFNDITLSFAAGIMLAAAVLGLIIPAMESGEGAGNLLVVIAGILCGAVFLSLMDKVVPHLHHITGVDTESHGESTKHLNRVMLFVMAIAIHNLPEGIAAGVSFGTGNISDALTVAGGIALQNIPEGMVIISPMLNAGVPKSRAFRRRNIWEKRIMPDRAELAKAGRYGDSRRGLMWRLAQYYKRYLGLHYIR